MRIDATNTRTTSPTFAASATPAANDLSVAGTTGGSWPRAQQLGLGAAATVGVAALTTGVVALTTARRATSVARAAELFRTNVAAAEESLSRPAASETARGVQLLRETAEAARNGYRFPGGIRRQNLLEHVRRMDATGNGAEVIDVYTRSARETGISPEHVWPKSLGATGLAGLDLHNVLPADFGSNRWRSSLPFGEVIGEVRWSSSKKAPGISRVGEDADGSRVFEPDTEARGRIARSMLYFAIRHGEDPEVPISFTNFRKELPKLMRWHAEHPVTPAERLRNDRVEAFQGNRNPIVDHPEIVEEAGMPGFLGFIDERHWNFPDLPPT